MSQKPFVWNNNNPVEWEDPSGYDPTPDPQPAPAPNFQCGPCAPVDNSLPPAAQAIINIAAMVFGRGEVPEEPFSVEVGTRNAPIEIPRGTNSPATIGGRAYSGHSLDEMQSSGITPSVVEDAIRNNIGTPGKTPGTTVFDSKVNGIRAVVNDEGKVITVTPISRVNPPNKP